LLFPNFQFAASGHAISFSSLGVKETKEKGSFCCRRRGIRTDSVGGEGDVWQNIRYVENRAAEPDEFRAFLPMKRYAVVFMKYRTISCAASSCITLAVSPQTFTPTTPRSAAGRSFLHAPPRPPRNLHSTPLFSPSSTSSHVYRLEQILLSNNLIRAGVSVTYAPLSHPLPELISARVRGVRLPGPELIFCFFVFAFFCNVP
jgi:hypothetical protein